MLEGKELIAEAKRIFLGEKDDLIKKIRGRVSDSVVAKVEDKVGKLEDCSLQQLAIFWHEVK